MIIALFFIGLILLVPIYLTVYAFYDDYLKRLYFAIYIFGFFKGVSGYVKLRRSGGVYVHLKNKAIIVDNKFFKSLSGGNGGFSKVITVTEVDACLDVGLMNLNVAFFVWSIFKALDNFFMLYKSNNSSIEIKNNLNLYLDGDDFKAFKLKVKTYFNLISIVWLIFANYKRRIRGAK